MTYTVLETVVSVPHNVSGQQTCVSALKKGKTDRKSVLTVSLERFSFAISEKNGCPISITSHTEGVDKYWSWVRWRDSTKRR